MKSKMGTSIRALAAVFLALSAMEYAAAADAQPGADASAAAPRPGATQNGAPPIKVVSITFLGNKKISTQELTDVVAQTPLKIGAPVGAPVVAPAMKAIVAYYKKKGMTPTLSPDIIEDPKGVSFVQIIVDESTAYGDVSGLVSGGTPLIFCGVKAGPPSGSGPSNYRDPTPVPSKGLASISFVGNKKISTEQLQSAVAEAGLKLGMAVNPAVVAPATKALLDLYRKNAAALSVSPDIIENSQGLVAVQFVIDETGSKGDLGLLVPNGGPRIFCH